MCLMKRTRIILLLVCGTSFIILLLLCLVHWVPIWLSTLHENPERRARINALIATLENETWDESVRNLVSDGNEYLSPWYLSRKFEQGDLDMMLSSRRSIKILNTLEALSMKERIERCKELFNKVAEMYEASVRSMDEPASDTGKEKLTANPRFAFCAALFATAETGDLGLLADQCSKVDNLRKRVEAYFDAHKTNYSKIDVELGLKFSVPDQSCMMTVLRLAASRSRSNPELLGKIDALCQENMTSDELPIVPWNARTTWFENQEGMDTRRGVTTYRIFRWKETDMLVNDDAQRELVAKVLDLVLDDLGRHSPTDKSQ